MEVVPWKNTVFRSTSALGARICKAFLVFWGIFLTCLFTLVLSVAFEFFIEGYTHYDPGLLDVSRETLGEIFRLFRPMEARI